LAQFKPDDNSNTAPKTPRWMRMAIPCHFEHRTRKW